MAGAGGVLVAGAVLGLPFNILYDVIKEVLKKTTMFKPLLLDLSSTMDSLYPLMNDITRHNKALGRPREELQYFKKQMENGAELVRKCSTVSLLKRNKYTNKLIELDKSLNRLLTVLTAQGLRAGLETLEVVKETLTRVKRIEDNSVGKQDHGHGSRPSKPKPESAGPYDGLCDLALTYGRPLEPSEETCYPRSSSYDDQYYHKPREQRYEEYRKPKKSYGRGNEEEESEGLRGYGGRKKYGNDDSDEVKKERRHRHRNSYKILQ